MNRLIFSLLIAAAALVGAVAMATAAAPVPLDSIAATPSSASRQILVLLRAPAPNARPGGSYGGVYGDTVARAARKRVGQRLAQQYQLQLDGEWPMPLIGLDCLIFSVSNGDAVDAAITRLERDKDVEWVQPMHSFAALNQSTPYNDPLFPATPAARQWHLADLHRISTGRGVTIAIVDSQIERSHPDLVGQVIVSKDFVDGRPTHSEEHGTGVAGVIAAKANNGVGSAGVAPAARLMGLRACWQINAPQGTICNTLSLAKALHYAIERNVEIINLSLTGPPDPLLARLIEVGLARSIIIVASVDVSRVDRGFPASIPGVVAVSDGHGITSNRAVFSAPGHGIPTTQSRGRWHLVSGTSFSAAHVSGLLALMREGPRSARRAEDALILIPGGGGTIDAKASVQRAATR